MDLNSWLMDLNSKLGGFALATCGFKLVTLVFEHVTCGFELSLLNFKSCFNAFNSHLETIMAKQNNDKTILTQWKITCSLSVIETPDKRQKTSLYNFYWWLWTDICLLDKTSSGRVTMFHSNKPEAALHKCSFFLIGIHSMQSGTVTTRHGVTKKRSTKRLKHAGNLFRKPTVKRCLSILDLKPLRS